MTIRNTEAINGTYTVTKNGEVIAAGLTNAQAWREAERLEPRTVENTTDRVWRYQRQR